MKFSYRLSFIPCIIQKSRDISLIRLFLSPVLETTWFGLLPYATTGTNFQPGATRSYTFPTSIGIYNITEQLTFFHTDPSGSFKWKFEQAPFNVPVEYRTGNGSFSGYWATMETQRVFQNETSIVWTAYLCATGHPLSKQTKKCTERKKGVLTSIRRLCGVSVLLAQQCNQYINE